MNLNALTKKELWVFVLTLWLSSCAAPERIIYFQDKEGAEFQSADDDYTPVFKKDDLLSIIVSGLDPDAVKPFNMPSGESESSTQQGYLIDADGMIDLPILGSIEVAGLNRTQATTLITKQLSAYITNPIVNIRILNFKITILGEVNSPGTYTIPNERITLPEALGLAGDMTINGIRENILVIRDIDGEKIFNRVDMTSKEVFSSPIYYLSQNDVVYVEPNKPRMHASKVSPSTGLFISATGLLLSILTLFLIRL